MGKYDYREHVKGAIRSYIENNKDCYDWSDLAAAREKLYDDMLFSDSVTGNGSGSYTFSTWAAEENLCHNLDLLQEACEELNPYFDLLKNGAEAGDVIIRGYLVGFLLDEVIDELPNICLK